MINTDKSNDMKKLISEKIQYGEEKAKNKKE